LSLLLLLLLLMLLRKSNIIVRRRRNSNDRAVRYTIRKQSNRWFLSRWMEIIETCECIQNSISIVIVQDACNGIVRDVMIVVTHFG
jgi:hypothetical protein